MYNKNKYFGLKRASDATYRANLNFGDFGYFGDFRKWATSESANSPISYRAKNLGQDKLLCRP